MHKTAAAQCGLSAYAHPCRFPTQAVLEIIKLSGAKLSKSEKPETLRKLDKVGCGDGARACQAAKGLTERRVRTEGPRKGLGAGRKGPKYKHTLNTIASVVNASLCRPCRCSRSWSG